MTNLVFKNESGKPVTNSLLVAEKFGKLHKDVLESIRVLIKSAENSAHLLNLFIESTYLDSMNREKPMYVMNRDGFSLLVMGFTGEKALNFKLEYIEAFNQMEETIKSNGFQLPQTFSDALRLAAEQAEQIEVQQKQLKEQAPRVLFAQAVETSQKSCLIGELAKILKQNGIEIGQNRLFSWMRQNGYLCSSGERYNQPTQKAMDLGLLEIKKTTNNNPDGSIRVNVTTKVTGKGQIYFVNKFIRRQAC